MQERTKRENRRVFTLDEKKIMLSKSNGRCAHCGTKLSVNDNFTVEHVIPISKGGSNDISNLVGLCKKCNKEKSNYIYLPSDYYKYVKRVYLEELLRNHDVYCKETNWITSRNAFKEDAFTVSAKVPLKGNLLVGRKKKGFVVQNQVSVTISRKVRRVVYSDMDTVYYFYRDYYNYYGVDISAGELKSFLTDSFNNGALYIVEGKNIGEICLVLKILFIEQDGMCAISVDIAGNPKVTDRNSALALSTMLIELLDRLSDPLGGDVKMAFVTVLSYLKKDSLVRSIISDYASGDGRHEWGGLIAGALMSEKMGEKYRNKYDGHMLLLCNGVLRKEVLAAKDIEKLLVVNTNYHDMEVLQVKRPEKDSYEILGGRFLYQCIRNCDDFRR